MLNNQHLKGIGEDDEIFCFWVCPNIESLKWHLLQNNIVFHLKLIREAPIYRTKGYPLGVNEMRPLDKEIAIKGASQIARASHLIFYMQVVFTKRLKVSFYANKAFAFSEAAAALAP